MRPAWAAAELLNRKGLRCLPELHPLLCAYVYPIPHRVPIGRIIILDFHGPPSESAKYFLTGCPV
jgi:hypothetical protein